MVSHDAGLTLSRAEAIAYVHDNADRYIEEAKAQAKIRPIGLNVIIVLDRHVENVDAAERSN
jgi:hypothetical protein